MKKDTVQTAGADPGFSEVVRTMRLPTLSNCYCYLTSPFFTRKSMVKIPAFHSRGFNRTTPRSAQSSYREPVDQINLLRDYLK